MMKKFFSLSTIALLIGVSSFAQSSLHKHRMHHKHHRHMVKHHSHHSGNDKGTRK